MHRETKEISKAMTVLPRLMRHFLGSFKPGVDIPVKKNEIKALFEMDMHPGLPMKHYADAVDMEFGSFTYLCDKLQEKDLVNRVHSENDKRVTVLKMTDTGNKLVDKIKDEFDDHVLERIKTLDKKDLGNLSKSVRQLEEILSKLES